MKKIETSLFNFCRFLNDRCVNMATVHLFLLCLGLALIIRRCRKKDAEDFEDQKAFDDFFRRANSNTNKDISEL